MVDVFIIEDNTEITQLIETFLHREGLTTRVCHNGRESLEQLEEETAKIVLLDIMLPELDGFGVLSRIREEDNIPVIMMSALTDKEAMMNGFVLGADDYVEKPIDIDILIAKIKALLKRNYEWKKENKMIHSGELSVDKEAKSISLNHEKLALTIKEYELLLLFIENPGKTLHKDYLFGKIWGMDSFSENQTIE